MAAEEPNPPEREPHGEPLDDEEVTGSLERVSREGDADESALSQVRDATFPIALRGYERESVDAYVQRVERLVAELEASRSPEAAIRRALDQVGEETSGILQRAQETASEITARSRASADDRLRQAEREARELVVDAEDRVRELEADFGAIWTERDRLLGEVRDLAERLLATADGAEDRVSTQADAQAAASASSDTASMRALTAAPEPRGDEEPPPASAAPADEPGDVAAPSTAPGSAAYEGARHDEADFAEVAADESGLVGADEEAPLELEEPPLPDRPGDEGRSGPRPDF